MGPETTGSVVLELREIILFVGGFTPAPQQAWFRASSIVPFFQTPLYLLELGVSQKLGSGLLPRTLPGLDSKQGK